MKKVLYLSLLLFVSLCVSAQREFSMTEGDTTFVMKRYVLMLLNKGPDRSQDSVQAAEIQKGHLEHLNKMAESGKLVIAGPFENGGEHRGLLIFDVETIDEATKLESEDPAVKSGRLKMEAIYWWGAKGSRLP